MLPRTPLFVVISAAIAAGCGSGDTVPVGSSDARADATDASGGDASDGATEAAADTGADVAPQDASTDDALPTVRRPFLVGSSMRAAPARSRRDWADANVVAPADLPADVAEFLARAWLKDALEEHASVAAFARFTLQLLALGAPPELVAQSQKASIDEIEHARTCFALAARYGAGATGPGPLSLAGAVEAPSIEDVVRLSAMEACVGETLGAALAADQLAVARDPIVRAALQRIARDEARHAALGWRFAAWAVRVGGAPARSAFEEGIAEALEATRSTKLVPPRSSLALLHDHGRLSCVEARASAERTIAVVVEPARAELRRAVA